MELGCTLPEEKQENGHWLAPKVRREHPDVENIRT
jgi:hypothetical protein